MVSARAASTPKPPAILSQSRSGLPRSKRLRAAGPDRRAHLAHLVLEDGVFAVGEDHGGHRQPLARLRPERLDGVEGGAVGLEVDDAAAGRPDRGAGGERQAVADRAADQAETVVRRRVGHRRDRSRSRRSRPRRRRSPVRAGGRRGSRRPPSGSPHPWPAPASGAAGGFSIGAPSRVGEAGERVGAVFARAGRGACTAASAGARRPGLPG